MHSKRLTGVAVAAVVALGTVVLPATSASEHQRYVPRPQRNRGGAGVRSATVTADHRGHHNQNDIADA